MQRKGFTFMLFKNLESDYPPIRLQPLRFWRPCWSDQYLSLLAQTSGFQGPGNFKVNYQFSTENSSGLPIVRVHSIFWISGWAFRTKDLRKQVHTILVTDQNMRLWLFSISFLKITTGAEKEDHKFEDKLE